MWKTQNYVILVRRQLELAKKAEAKATPVPPKLEAEAKPEGTGAHCRSGHAGRQASVTLLAESINL